jgi:hypothetical protein
MPCAPNNLVYNDTQKQCDWPYNSKCVVFPVDTTTATPTQSTTTPPPSGGDFVCPRDDIANTGCMGPKDCLYPNPANCNSFIQCVPQPDGSGKPVVMPCPAGLEWNDNKKECDYPQDSTCPKNSTQTPTTAATTQTPTTAATTQTPTTAATTPLPPGGDFVCPRDDIANTGCMGPKDCLYPNPANCNSFIQCVPQPDGSGKPVVMPCPAGLEWNDNKKECDYPQDSTCPKNSTQTPTTAAPTTAAPTTAAPTTAAPTTAAPTTAAPTTAAPTTAAPTTAAPTTAAPTTAAPTTAAPTSPPTTPACGDDSSEDNNLDLPSLCSGCSQKRLVANPNSQQRYIECNGGENGNQNSVQKCSPGLLFNSNKLTCDYAGLVNPKGY